ncbi:hypothetical protein PoB_003977100 [Plakobranchus ocellatus]|uniref:Uncharacterized protein n=1 Tax=Plakobranchus ocellatus TaxID=259542 RepID=A0AAV4AYD3_9GAST|nr:hypothetical protein PoB_003977100 [Plakobranchus ocellatus]
MKIEFGYETPPYARSNPTATTSDAGESTHPGKKGRPDHFQPIQNKGELLGQLKTKTSNSRDKYTAINEIHDSSIVSKKLRKPLQNNNIFQSQDKNDRIILQSSKSSYEKETAAQDSLPKDLEKQTRTANHSQEKSKTEVIDLKQINDYKRSQEESKINIAFPKYKVDSKTSHHKVTPAKQQDDSIQSQERHKIQITSPKQLENIKQPQAESNPEVKSQNPTDIREKDQDQHNDSKISDKQSGIPLTPHLPSSTAHVPSEITEIVDAEVHVNNNQPSGSLLRKPEKETRKEQDIHLTESVQQGSEAHQKSPTQKPYGIADKIRSWSEKSRTAYLPYGVFFAMEMLVGDKEGGNFFWSRTDTVRLISCTENRTMENPF